MDGSRAETGLRRKRTGKEAEQRRELRLGRRGGWSLLPQSQALERPPEGRIARGLGTSGSELLLFGWTEPRPQGVCSEFSLHTGTGGSETMSSRTWLYRILGGDPKVSRVTDPLGQ